MQLSRRAQLILLATLTLTVAVASTCWWLSSSPQAVRRMAVAMMLLATGVCALQQCQRLPKGSPLVLATTLVGLAVAFLTR